MGRTIACASIACLLLTAAACAAPAAPSHPHPAASSASTHVAPQPGSEILARAKSAFVTAASVTVTVFSTSAGDAAPPFGHWTETVTAHGKTTDPPFPGTGMFAGPDPITCSSLATCADYYFNTENFPLDVSRVGGGHRAAFRLYAQGSADLGMPGWITTIDAKTYAPINIIDGWSCTHCYFLTFYFRLTPRR